MEDPIRADVVRTWRTRLVWSRPNDQAAAEQAVRNAYLAASLPPPREILWADGPEHAHKLLGELNGNIVLPWFLLGIAVTALIVELVGQVLGYWSFASHSRTEAAPLVLGFVLLGAVLYLVPLQHVLQFRHGRISLGILAYLLVMAAAFVGMGDRISLLPLAGWPAGLIAIMVLPHLRLPRRDRPEVRPGRPVSRRINAALRMALGGPRWPRNMPPVELGNRFRAAGDVLRLALPPERALVSPLATDGQLVRARLMDVSDGVLNKPSAKTFIQLARDVDAFWAYTNVAVILAPPPEVHVDQSGLFHSTTGAAVRWRDGCELFAVHGGLIADATIVRNPGRLSLEQVRSEPDADLRRILIERFGPERIMSHPQARKVGQDECGELWRFNDFDGEALVMVKVINSTPEPDGTHKIYWLRVPPHVTSAQEGVAWTFGITGAHAYQPLVET
jgi:hypothetical protein